MTIITTSRTFEVSFPLDLHSPRPTSSNSEETLVSELLDIPLPPPSKVPEEILTIDRDTPDHHVPRDPRLIRLTGVHPFNVEAPLTELFNEGSLMSQSLVLTATERS
jgi:nitrate reductase (NAD(P)H)